jgi:hypothetical protein
MAENKKSFLLYADLIHTISKMPKEKAGELFMHILEYVNGKNPETDDLIIQLTFEPIKQALKRDLQKYENIRLKNIENANKRWNKNNATASERMPSNTKNAVNGNVSDNVNDNVNDILLEKETKELFNTWVNYRKEIKKPIKSLKTKKSIAEKINEIGFEKSKLVIEKSITNGWQGLFWENVNNNKNNNNEPTINRQTTDTIRKNSQGWGN